MSKKHYNKNNRQRRDNLVGLKYLPPTKAQTHQDYSRCQRVIKNYEKERCKAINTASEKVGFDINKDYCVNPYKKLGDIPLIHDKHPQKVSIPINDDIVQRFINAPKYVLKTVETKFDGDKHKHEKQQMLCCAVLDEGVVVFEFYVHRKFPPKNPDEELQYNIGFNALLNGTQYFHIDRYDNFCDSPHRETFDKDGNLSLKMISKHVYENKGHTHPYNQKFAVMFPGKDHVGHEDRVVQTRYSSLATAVRAIKKKLNIQDRVVECNDEMTFAQIEQIIKELETQKNTNSNKEVKCAIKRTSVKPNKGNNNQRNLGE